MTGKIVKIKPISKRAKDRVKQHGEKMLLQSDYGSSFCVRSLGNTWRGETWTGWFNKNVEANYEEEKARPEQEEIQEGVL